MANRRIPANVHKLKGTHRKDRHGEAGHPIVSGNYPEAPKHVLKYDGALEIWNEIKAAMESADIYTSADSNKLSRYCILEAEFRNDPLLFSTITARLTQLRLLENDLYLSPESRAKIVGKKSDTYDRVQNFSQFL